MRSENIHVTFFTVGLPLEDASTNLSTVYLDMQARGHQIALHSFTHPKMEGLPDYAAIDWSTKTTSRPCPRRSMACTRPTSGRRLAPRARA